MEQRKLTEAQKKAQKKYDEKTKNVSLKFTPKTMKLYDQLKEYTDRNGKTINGFIKELIVDFFENDRKQIKKTPVKEPIPKNLDDMYSTYYCSYIDDESIQVLNDTYGSAVTEKILHELYESLEGELEEVLERCSDDFEDWIKELPDRIENEEVILDSKKDIAKTLADDMHYYTAI